MATVALALLLAAGAAAAATYRWVDENGRVQFSDRPPPEAHAERLGPALPTGTSSDVNVAPDAGDATSPSEAEQRDAAKRAEEEKAYAESQAQIAATKRRNCQTARTNLRKLQAEGDVMVPSADGGRKLSDAERQRMIRDTRARASENCTP
jgi:hypothetical protein